MQQIQRFNFHSAPITAIEYDGEPALLLSDVAHALQYADPRDARKCLVGHPEAMEGREYITVTGEMARTIASLAEGGTPSANMRRSTTIIRESGVYLLLMTSRTKVATEFQGWAARELFPALRKGEQAQRQTAPDLREVAGVIAHALRDGLQPLAARVADIESRLDAAGKAVETPVVPPPHAMRAGQIAAIYGVRSERITAMAAKLRRAYAVFGTRAPSDTWARGQTMWYSPAEVALLADRLGLRRVDESDGNVLSLFATPRPVSPSQTG